MVQKQITHRMDACDPGLRVHADRDRLAQILANLLTNAIKFTEPGGSITITCEADDDVVSMIVKDTGIGIPPDWIDSVFEPFVQVKSGLTNREGGVGLGLAISRDLARGMGGDLTVRSKAGEGSEFALRLNRAR
jgi:signal transduction histidine kinase